LKTIKYYFICEGSSDTSLVDHIDKLLLESGYEEVYGDAPDFGLIFDKSVGKSVKDKVNAILKYDNSVNILFIHRDADNEGYEAREAEIFEQTEHLEGYKIIPVIPVKRLESWLVLDEQVIKDTVGYPSSRANLGLPAKNHIEKSGSTKELLFEAMDRASGLTGKQLTKFQKHHNKFRHMLVQNLDPNGPVSTLQSHVKLRKYIDLLV